MALSFWTNPHPLRSWQFSKFPNWRLTTSQLNLQLVRSQQAEIIIVKRLIQRHNNVTRVPVEPRSCNRGLLLLFYRAASEGWQPIMSKEDTRESSLAQKCYWHRIIPEVGGHFDPCTKQGTPSTRQRPPLVGLKECSQMHKRGWNNIEKKASHYY